MIKATFKSILSIVILLILSCSTNHKSEEITEKQLHGQVKKVVEKHYFANSEFGEIKKGSLFYQRTSKYDNNGNLIQEFCEMDDGLKFIVGRLCDHKVHNNKYDNKGNLIEAGIYDLDGSLSSKFTYKYNDNKVLIEECQYLPRWQVQNDYKDFLEYKTTYEYDKNSNQIRKNTYGPSGSLTLIQTIKHDTKGNLIEDCRFDKTGNPTTKTIYRYDDNNNLVEESFFIKDRPADSKEFSYIYGDNGYLKEKNRLNNDSSVNKYTYSYDNLGNLIEVNSFSGAHLMEKSTKKYENFDKNGNWIIRTEFQNEVLKRMMKREIEYY